MNVQDILDLARDQTYTTVSQMPDNILLKYLNIVKNDFFSYLITSVSENYNWDYFTSNTVVWQDEYTYPEVAFDSVWLLKIQEVYINYDWKTYNNGKLQYRKAREVWQSLKKDWNYYLEYQNPEDPIYYIADRSVFIAPAPKQVVVWWIQTRWIRNIADYTIDTTESDIKIPIPYQSILIQWLLPYIYKKKWDLQKSSYETWEYIRQRTEIVRQLADRSTWTHYMNLPWEDYNLID